MKQIETIAVANCLGYSEPEIELIEAIYDIKIEGLFKEFLSVAGRSAGGAIGDYEVVLYRGYCNRQDHVEFQSACREDLLEQGYHELVAMKPFFFSVEGEAYYYFFLTLDAKDFFYVQDDNNGNKVEQTNFSFISYLERQISRELDFREQQKHPLYRFSRDVVVCQGDLLRE